MLSHQSRAIKLRERSMRKKLAERSVRTLSGVEGIKLNPSRKPKHGISRRV